MSGYILKFFAGVWLALGALFAGSIVALILFFMFVMLLAFLSG